MQHAHNTLRSALAASATLLLVWGCSDPETASVQVTADPDRVAVETPSITGRIIDAETRLPIGGALVETTPPTERRKADASGRYILTRGVEPNQTYTLAASAEGYVEGTAQVSVGAGKTLHGDLALTPEAIALETVTFEPEALRFTANQRTIQARLTASPNAPAGAPWQLTYPNSVSWLTLSHSDGTIVPDTIQDITLTLDPARALEAMAALGPTARSVQTTLTLTVGDRKLARDVVAVIQADAPTLTVSIDGIDLNAGEDAVVVDGRPSLEVTAKARLGAGGPTMPSARVTFRLGDPDAPLTTAEAYTDSDGAANAKLGLPTGSEAPSSLPLTLALADYPGVERRLMLVWEACPVRLGLALDGQADHLPNLYVDGLSRLTASASAEACPRWAPDGVTLALTTAPSATVEAPDDLTLDANGGDLDFIITPDSTIDQLTAELRILPEGQGRSSPASIVLERLDHAAPFELANGSVLAVGEALRADVTFRTPDGDPIKGLTLEHTALCVEQLGADAEPTCTPAFEVTDTASGPLYRFEGPRMPALDGPAKVFAQLRIGDAPDTGEPMFAALDQRHCVVAYPDITTSVTLDNAGVIIEDETVTVTAVIEAPANAGVNILVAEVYAADDAEAPVQTRTMTDSDEGTTWTTTFQDLDPDVYTIRVTALFASQETCEGYPQPQLVLDSTPGLVVEARESGGVEALGPDRIPLLIGEPVTVTWRTVGPQRELLEGNRWDLDEPDGLVVSRTDNDSGVFRPTLVANQEGDWIVPLRFDGVEVAQIRVYTTDPVLITPEPIAGNHDGVVHMRGCQVWRHSLVHPAPSPVDLSLTWIDDNTPDTIRPITRGANPESTLRGVVPDEAEDAWHRFAWDTVRDAGLTHTEGQLTVTASSQGFPAGLHTAPIEIRNGIMLDVVEFAPNATNPNAADAVWRAGSFGYDGQPGGLALLYEAPDGTAHIARFPGDTDNGTYGFGAFDVRDSVATGIVPGGDTLEYLALLTAQLGASLPEEYTGPELIVVHNILPPGEEEGEITILEGPGGGDFGVPPPDASGAEFLGFLPPKLRFDRAVTLNTPDGPGTARIALLNETQIRVVSGPPNAPETALVSDDVAVIPMDVAVGRFTHDDWDDLAVFHTAIEGSALAMQPYYTDTDGVFSAASAVPTPLIAPSDVRSYVVDWDHDGRDDVVAAVVLGETSEIRLWLNTTPPDAEAPSFAQGRLLATLSFRVRSLHIDDLDADGRWDAAVLQEGRLRIVSGLGSEPDVNLDNTAPERLCAPDNIPCITALNGAWFIHQVLLRDGDSDGRSELILLTNEGLAIFEAEPPPTRCAATWNAPETVAPVTDPVAHHLVQLSAEDDALDLISVHETDADTSLTRYIRGERAVWERNPNLQNMPLATVDASAVFRGREPHRVSHVLVVNTSSFALQEQGADVIVGDLPGPCVGPHHQLHTADLDGAGLETAVLVCPMGVWRLDIDAETDTLAWAPLDLPGLVTPIDASAVAPVEGEGDARADLVVLSDTRLSVFYNAPGEVWTPATSNGQAETALVDVQDLHVGPLGAADVPAVILLGGDDTQAELQTFYSDSNGGWRASSLAPLDNPSPETRRFPEALTIFEHPEIGESIAAVVFKREVPGEPGQWESTVDLWGFMGSDQDPQWSQDPIPWPTPWRTFRGRLDDATFQETDIVAVDLNRDHVTDLAVLTPTPTFIHLPRTPETLAAPYVRPPNEDDNVCPRAIWLAQDGDGVARPRVDIKRTNDDLAFERVDFTADPWEPEACDETHDGSLQATSTRAVLTRPSSFPNGAVHWDGAAHRSISRPSYAAHCPDVPNPWSQSGETVTLDNPHDLRMLRAADPNRTFAAAIHTNDSNNLNAVRLTTDANGLVQPGITNEDNAVAGSRDQGLYAGATVVDLNEDGDDDLLIFQNNDGFYTTQSAIFGQDPAGNAIAWNNSAEVSAAWVGDLDADGASDAVLFGWDPEATPPSAELLVKSNADTARWVADLDFGGGYTREARLGDAPIHRVERIRVPGSDATVLIASPSEGYPNAPVWVLVFGTDGALIQAQALLLGDDVSGLALDHTTPALYSIQDVPGGQCAVRRFDLLP